ncbi:MAG: hypothetical protein IPJ58_09670 [Ardenticatenia bacterium]|nr:hypothetical protein [Ardenticatenia bacterium]
MSDDSRLVVITANELESRAVIDSFRVLSRQTPDVIPLGDLFYRSLCKIDSLDVFMIESRQGSASLGGSLQTVQKAIDALAPTGVILVGTAFGTNPARQSLGDVLVSDRIMIYGPQRVGVKDRRTSIIPRGARPDASPRLLNICKTVRAGWTNTDIEVRVGLLLSGESLLDNPRLLKQLLRLEPEAIGGEMEASGVYAACHAAQVDWIVIKGLSDWGNGTKSQQGEFDQQLAAHNAAAFALSVIQLAARNSAIVNSVHETEFRQLRGLLDLLADAEFRDMIRSLLEPKEQNTMPSPLTIIDRGTFLGHMDVLGRLPDVARRLRTDYPERVLLNRKLAK